MRRPMAFALRAMLQRTLSIWTVLLVAAVSPPFAFGQQAMPPAGQSSDREVQSWAMPLLPPSQQPQTVPPPGESSEPTPQSWAMPLLPPSQQAQSEDDPLAPYSDLEAREEGDVETSVIPEAEDGGDQAAKTGGGLRTAKVHFVLVMDTDAKGEGMREAVKHDLENIDACLVKVAKNKGCLGSVEILRGSTVNPRNVLRAVRSLRVGKGDTLVCYYSGHGGIVNGVHYLNLSHSCKYTRNRHHYEWNNLARKQLFKEMSAKRPKLAVLLTDCCSSFSRTRMRQFPTGGSETDPWIAISQLFLGLRGVVNVTAAQPGTIARCNPDYGSYFTLAFCSTLNDDRRKLTNGDKLTWSRFLHCINQRTEDFGQEQRCYPYYIGR